VSETGKGRRAGGRGKKWFPKKMLGRKRSFPNKIVNGSPLSQEYIFRNLLCASHMDLDAERTCA